MAGQPAYRQHKFRRKSSLGADCRSDSHIRPARPSSNPLRCVVADACAGDILLTEQVDRLSRLTDGDWQKLKADLAAKRIRVVALDVPTSWTMAAKVDEFTARMFEAINAMLLDMLAAAARGLRRSSPTSGAGPSQSQG